MASILKVDTITGVATAGSIAITGEGNSTTTNLQNGLAKMWANFDPNTANTIVNSLNVASLSDNGTGDYALNGTNAFSDGFFVRLGGTTKGGGGPSGTNYTTGFANESTSTTTLGVCTVGNGGGSGPSAIELDQCFGLAHGDLA
tara:strand:+ start:88 stop:519 length:432 start_codon:yes stop_codon:yes gene_type:complete